MTKAGLVVLFLILVMSPAPVGAGTLLVPAEYPTIQASDVDVLLLEAFGGGFTWGSVLLKY